MHFLNDFLYLITLFYFVIHILKIKDNIIKLN